MKKFSFISIILVLVLILTAGCTGQQAAPPAQEGEQEQAETPEGEEAEDEFNPQILFNGSSTLAPVIASISTNFIEGYVTWDKVDPSFPEKNIAIYVSAGGSGQGVKSVIDKTSDFGMVARTVKDSEKEQLPELQEFLVGIDALTLGVNPNNPVLTVKDNLTKDEIVKIFSGEYKTWKDLDASLPDKEIIVVTRDIGGGAHEVFQSKVMGDVEVKPDAIQAPSMGALVSFSLIFIM
jgi:phosphate transport system substrate-binding protein